MHEAEDPLRLALVSALGAQYDVLRLIGRGGMGAVYLGRERLLDRLVAIKVLPHESADTEDARERFLREARTAARLTHPNVVPLFSFGEAGKTLFYIMGYVEGESLEQRLRRDGRLSPDETRRVLADLAYALEHAHGQGIVHRDIKPDNVLLEHGTGRPVLTDFGIARQQVVGHTLTHTGVVLGTPLYMSPEQAAGERDIDGRSDLYSLGVMGYRMLTGRLPFEGGSFQELLASHMTRDPAPLSVYAADVPEDLEAAIMRCLQKDPQRRWANAAMLKEGLGGGDGEVTLPPDLEKLPASGSTSAITGYYGLMLSPVLYVLTKGDLVATLIPLTPLLGGVIEYVTYRVRARRHGLSPKRVNRMAFWSPRPWNYWWPRAWRRPGDVWDRLPADIRRVRVVMSMAAIGAGAVFLPGVLGAITMAATNRGPEWLLRTLLFPSLVGMLGVLGALFWGAAYMQSWGKKMGLPSHDRDKLTTEPTWAGRFWRRPDIARLLENSTSQRVEPRMENPSDVVAALERLGDELKDPWRQLLAEGIAVARSVVHSVAHLDEELKALARDNDPVERERLQQRLASMNDTIGGSRQMRELVAGQLSLMNQLTRRAEDIASRRSRYMELLRTMWLQFSALRAHQASDAMAVGATTGQLRELCRDVEHALAAEQTLASTAAAPEPHPHEQGRMV